MSDRDANAFDREYQALAEGRGFVELSGWTSVAVMGADRQSFLHNFCTNDIKRLQPGESCEAFFTNVKGRIVGHGVVICGGESVDIVAAPGQASRLIEHLDRYVIREDVQLRDATAEKAHLLVAGDFVVDGARSIDWNLLGARPSRLLEVSAAELSGVRESLLGRGAIECGLAELETLRIEGGVPLYGVDFDENNLPQEVGRDREAISFTKGCYLGQETVARIDAMGHVNQRLVGVKFRVQEVPRTGLELLHAGKKAGQVTSAVFSPKLGAPLALAMVRREHTAIGSRLESAVGACEVIVLPLT